MSEERYTHVHPYTKYAQGMLSDWGHYLPYFDFVEFDRVLTQATHAAKDVETERDKYRAALEEIVTNGSPAARALAREALR